MPADPDLVSRRCRPCEGGIDPLTPAQAGTLAARLDGWDLRDTCIEKLFRFPDYWRTQAFVNAVMWIAHREDHHPELEVGFGSVRVRYWTHAIGGLSENDFVCAAKVDALVAGEQAGTP